jgi:hypothetical protein
MPAEERVRGDEERLPAHARKESARRRQEGPVSRVEVRTCGQPSQDGEFVAKHEDFEFL